MLLTEKLLDIPLIRRSNALRTFILSAWLGWQIESNWASPFLFAIYSIARPLATIMIIVVMYSVITDGKTGEPIFAYIYLGNALYILVSQVVSGVSWSVIDDRERYRVMKQLHTAPLEYYFYLMGRGVARLIIGSISVLLTIGFGILFFRLPVTFTSIDWPLLIVCTALGVVGLACMGLILGAFTMTMTRDFWGVGELLAGALYLFTGAIFPIDILPAVLRPIGLIFPATYWLELARRALLGENTAKFPTFAQNSNTDLLLILAVLTVIYVAISVVYYRVALHAAKEKGVIDMESSF